MPADQDDPERIEQRRDQAHTSPAFTAASDTQAAHQERPGQDKPPTPRSGPAAGRARTAPQNRGHHTGRVHQERRIGGRSRFGSPIAAWSGQGRTSGCPAQRCAASPEALAARARRRRARPAPGRRCRRAGRPRWPDQGLQGWSCSQGFRCPRGRLQSAATGRPVAIFHPGGVRRSVYPCPSVANPHSTNSDLENPVLTPGQPEDPMRRSCGGTVIAPQFARQSAASCSFLKCESKACGYLGGEHPSSRSVEVRPGRSGPKSASRNGPLILHILCTEHCTICSLWPSSCALIRRRTGLYAKTIRSNGAVPARHPAGCVVA